MSDALTHDNLAPTRPVDRLQFGFRRRLPVQLQTESAECGLTCLAMIATFHGIRTDVMELRQQFSISARGLTFGNLADIAAHMKLIARPLQLSLEELSQLRTPCILHWDLNHFVVLEQVKPNEIVIHDPAQGRVRIPRSEASKRFTGLAMEFTPGIDFVPRARRKPMSMFRLLGRTTGLKSALTQIFLLAIALEVFSLAAPLLNQWVIDHAVVSGDRDLLLVLGLGFALLIAIQAAINALRAWFVLVMSTRVNLQWLSNAFSHLVDLPLAYFEKRHLGDVMSRFNAIHVIQNTLTVRFVEAIIDGMMAAGTLAMMCLYSVQLAAIGIVVVCIYFLLRLMLQSGLLLATEAEVVLAARQESSFMETVRGIQSVKLFQKGPQRVSRWLNLVVDQKNAQLRSQRLLLGFGTANHLLFGLETIAVVVLGGIAVLDTKLTVGMLFAFLSFKTLFSARVSALIDKLFELRLLRIQGRRLSDILLTPPETKPTPLRRDATSIPASISLVNVGLRYGDQEPFVLRHCNLSVQEGQAVVIIGPSGCGKSTLLKALTGLIDPAEGDIQMGGISVRHMGVGRYRGALGVVMQDDQLFSGSIADNISFFDPHADFDRIARCTEATAIHEEIVRMPMGYQTLVGDMGSTLSGGQRQRILLARALYKQPRILMIDEATSHLDPVNESLVSNALANLNVTRFIITHRPEAYEFADRAFRISDSTLVELRPNEINRILS